MNYKTVLYFFSILVPVSIISMHAASDAAVGVDDDQDFGSFIVKHTVASRITGELGTKVKEKIDLSREDFFSGLAFKQHLLRDQKRGFPWIFAIYTHETHDGHLPARDYADGRYLHQFVMSFKNICEKIRHPQRIGRFIKSITYFTVEAKGNKLKAKVLGNETRGGVGNQKEMLTMYLLKLEPGPKDLVKIGLNYFLRSKSKKAVTWCERAVTATQDTILYSSALKRLADAYLQNKDFDKALECCAKVLPILQREGKTYDDVLTNITSIYKEKQDWDKTIEWGERAIRVVRDFYILNDLAYAYEQKGKITEAFSHYTEAYERDGNIISLLHLIYLFATYRDQCSLNERYARELLQTDSDDKGLLFYQLKYPDRYAHVCSAIEQSVTGSC